MSSTQITVKLQTVKQCFHDPSYYALYVYFDLSAILLNANTGHTSTAAFALRNPRGPATENVYPQGSIHLRFLIPFECSHKY